MGGRRHINVYVMKETMTQLSSYTRSRWKHKWCYREEPVQHQKSKRTVLELDPVWWKRGITAGDRRHHHDEKLQEIIGESLRSGVMTT